MMKRTCLIVLGVLVAYVGISSLLHWVVFPEPGPDPDDQPKAGDTIQSLREERAIVRKPARESGGTIFEFDVFMAPHYGVPIPHIHGSQAETFRIIDGTFRFALDGEELILHPGESITVPAGSTHEFSNTTDEEGHVIADFQPAGQSETLWLQRHRYFRNRGITSLEDLSPSDMLQVALLQVKYDGGYPPAVAPSLLRAAYFLIAPTARLFGYRSYYPPAETR